MAANSDLYQSRSLLLSSSGTLFETARARKYSAALELARAGVDTAQANAPAAAQAIRAFRPMFARPSSPASAATDGLVAANCPAAFRAPPQPARVPCRLH